MGFVSGAIVGEGGEPVLAAKCGKEGIRVQHAKLGRDQLILEYLPIVSSVVQAMVHKLPPFLDREDLVGAGVVGLIAAAERFDSSRAVRFRTYAELRVRGAILDYLRSLSWAPRGIHRKMREVDHARTSIECREGRTATLNDVACEMGLPLDELTTLLVEAQRTQLCPIEGLNEDHISHGVWEIEGDPFVHLERKELLEVVGAAIEDLPERQKLLLWLYYYEQLTMKEAGVVLGVNEARTSQIHSKAISALRERVKRSLAAAGAETCDPPDKQPLRRAEGPVPKRSRRRAKDNLSESRGI